MKKGSYSTEMFITVGITVVVLLFAAFVTKYICNIGVNYMNITKITGAQSQSQLKGVGFSGLVFGGSILSAFSGDSANISIDNVVIQPDIIPTNVGTNTFLLMYSTPSYDPPSQQDLFRGVNSDVFIDNNGNSLVSDLDISSSNIYMLVPRNSSYSQTELTSTIGLKSLGINRYIGTIQYDMYGIRIVNNQPCNTVHRDLISSEGLIGRWKLLTDTHEYSGSGVDGTPSNVVFDNSGALFNDANGATASITVSPYSLLNNATLIDVSAIINSVNQNSQYIVSHIDLSNAGGFQMKTDFGGKVCINIIGITSGFTCGNINVIDGNDHTVEFSYDGKYTTIFVDGSIDTQQELSGAPSISPNPPTLFIGNLDTSSTTVGFQGHIRDVTIYGRGLTGKEKQGLLLGNLKNE